MWLWLVGSAFADTLVLDNGAEVRGAIVSWNEGGGCVLRVDEGALEGVVVQLPCERIRAFARDEVVATAPAPAPAPAPVAEVEEKPRSRNLLSTLQEEWAAVKDDVRREPE